VKPAAPVSITLSNELKLRHLPPVLRDSLMARLEMENPQYVEATRLGRWTRGMPKVLRFHRRLGADGLVVPRGFIRPVVDMCRQQGIHFCIEDRRRDPAPVDFTFQGELKPFQEKAVADCLAKDFGVLSAPTGSGKTVMALAVVAARRRPTLIVVHTRELQDQWIERIGSFLGLPPERIGRIGGGRVDTGKEITVAMVQTLYKHLEAVVPAVGFLVVDECHRCPSRTFTEAVTAFDCRYMLGLSATPWRRDKLSRLIFWHLGNTAHEIEHRRLVASGDVLDAEVIMRETDFKPYFDPVTEYSRMLSELTADDARNRLIAADVAREAAGTGGTILVLSDRRRHCEILQGLLRLGHGVPAEKLTGDMPAADRQALLERINRGEVRVVVATGQLVGEGFDCRNLSSLFLATPIRFSGRVIQYLGRVLRPAPGKQKARVFDYLDARVDVLVAAARARQRVYDRGAASRTISRGRPGQPPLPGDG
jgi:superfamily II DNA or RNA helicase